MWITVQELANSPAPNGRSIVDGDYRPARNIRRKHRFNESLKEHFPIDNKTFFPNSRRQYRL
jgi:hypothetical protein